MNKKIHTTRLLAAFLFAHIAASLVSAQTAVSPRTFNEVHILRSLMQIHNAQMTYSNTAGNGNFGSLQNLLQAGFIDSALGTGSKYGYTFVVSTTPWIPWTPTTPGVHARYTVAATPRLYRKSGIRSFYIDAEGEIRGGDKSGMPATASDPIIDFDLCTRGVIADNERCFIETLRWLHGAEMTYASTHGNGNFGSLIQIREMSLITQRMSTGVMRGYAYTVSTTPRSSQTPATFRITAVPQIYGTTGISSFFIDTSGVIYAADRKGGTVDQNDPPLE